MRRRIYQTLFLPVVAVASLVAMLGVLWDVAGDIADTWMARLDSASNSSEIKP